MMCSSWKISMFGIVALMLAFGLATTDALATKTGVTVVATGTENVRAASEITLTFTVTFDDIPSADVGDDKDDKSGDVTINIPSVWSRPIAADDETIGLTDNALEVGEVLIGATSGNEEIDDGDDGALDDTDLFGMVSSPNIIARAGKDLVTQAISFAFRTTAPPNQGVYTISVSAPKFDLMEGHDKIRIVVGPVGSGADSGEVVMRRSPTALPAQPDTDDDLFYENSFVVDSEESLNNLIFTFTAKGTMSSGSTVVLNLAAAWPDLTHRDDDTEVAVSGSATSRLTVVRGTETVTATVKDDATLRPRDTIVFTIRKTDFKAPKLAADTEPARPNALEDGWTFTVTSSIGVATVTSNLLEDDGVTFQAEPLEPVRDPFNIVTTKPHGTGKLALHLSQETTDFQYYVAGADITDKTLKFTWTDLAGIGQGAKFEFMIPEPWPRAFVPIGADDPANGAISATGGEITVDATGRIVTGEFTDEPDNPTGPTLTYRVDKAPADQGVYRFPAKASAGIHGDPALLADGSFPRLELTVGPGKGSVALMRGGAALTQTTSEADLGDLTFVFTPGGRMAAGSKVEIDLAEDWTPFREDSGPGQNPAGEIVLNSTKGNVIVTGDRITFVTTEVLTAADRITFTYRGVKAPKVGDDDSDSFTFESRANSYPGESIVDGVLTGDIADPNVGIGRAADGAGSIALSVEEADAGSVIAELQIVYTAAGKMEIGSVVEVSLPANGNWDAPSHVAGDKGYTVLGDRSSDLTLTETTMKAETAVVLNTGDQLVFKYQNVTAPIDGGTYTFTAKSSSAPGSDPVALSTGGDTITIKRVAAGTMVLSDASGVVASASPGAELGNLTFMFTAGARMEVGSEVTVEILPGWTRPSYDIDGVDDTGDVTLAGSADLNISGGGGTAWVLKATTTTVLEPTDNLTFTYAMVTAPATEATYQFTTMVSVVAGGAPLPVENPPRVVVRAPVTAIAMTADPSSVFTGGEIGLSVTLWAGTAAGKALGTVVIDLDDGDAGGTFTPASITIADNTGEGTAAYTNSAAGTVTITATSGEMTDSADVEIKSTIRDLSVNGETEMALVTQGSTIMVRATGPVGGGTVTVLDEDGSKVGLKKALDPVGEPDADGDQVYSRSVDLPDVVADGMYTVSVEIQDDVNNSLQIQVVNDQTPPTVSNADASKAVVVNGDTLTLSADVAMNESMVAIASVIADLGGLDSTQATVKLDELSSSPGKYFTIITVNAANEDAANEVEDGEYTITITATDAIGNMDSDTVTVTLENDPSELHTAEVTPASGKPGETIWIKATGSEGGSPEATVTNSESGMKIAQVTLEEDADAAGSYVAGLMIVEDAHPVGVYDVTVTLGTKEIPLEGALTIEPAGFEFTLDIPANRSMIHIPLAVTQVNGVDMEINTVRGLYNALGDAVSFITTLADDGVTFNSYLGDDAPGSAYGDTAIGDDTGVIVNMSSAMTLALKGDALGSGGSAVMNLRSGLNLVGVPLQTGILPTLSAAINHPVFPGITHIVIMDENGQFQNVVAGTATDGPLMGGTGYFVITSAAFMLPVPGVAWENDGGSGSSAAPVALNPTSTSVLHVQGRLIDEVGMMSLDGLNVSFKNLSSGTVLGSTVATDDYSMTFVKIDTTAAKVGDILEINADSGNPLLGIRPVQHVVTAADVLNGSISLPDLVSYEIPAQSELLANYPNPFNPETWIPYRLAEDASVSVTIYGASGSLVRTIDVGFTPAAVYEGRSDAVYWDGRNNFGEQVSSGIYFYHLNAGDFSATRKMVIVK